MMLIALFFVVLLSFANGANDQLKGVATLLGSGTADYRRALSWATGWTVLGSITAAWLAADLLQAFSGKGLVADTLVHDPRFAAAVAGGAALTVLLATRFGFPVSTTHGLVGALVGSGMAAGASIQPGPLLMAYVVPLLLSPLCAFSAAVILYPALSWLRVRMGIVPDHCVCLASAVPEPVFAPSGIAAACRATPVSVKVGNAATCVETYSGHVCGIQAHSVLGVLHFGTAGVVSFARGLNDTPKIAALMLLGCDGAGVWPTLVVGACMALGGMLRGNRVAQTMSRRITEMNHGQGFTASALAGTIVIVASWLGLPVSTTHVMCGALMGIGATNGRAHGGTILGIVGAWLATLPCSMWLGAVCFRAMSSLAP